MWNTPVNCPGVRTATRRSLMMACVGFVGYTKIGHEAYFTSGTQLGLRRGSSYRGLRYCIPLGLGIHLAARSAGRIFWRISRNKLPTSSLAPYCLAASYASNLLVSYTIGWPKISIQCNRWRWHWTEPVAGKVHGKSEATTPALYR